MSELRLTPSQEAIETGLPTGHKSVSERERELNSFINSMASLIGPEASWSLGERWPDELACMNCIRESKSFNWRSVSLSASAKLASRVIASQLSGPFF